MDREVLFFLLLLIFLRSNKQQAVTSPAPLYDYQVYIFDSGLLGTGMEISLHVVNEGNDGEKLTFEAPRELLRF